MRLCRGLAEIDFLEVERELYRTRGDDIIDNPLFGTIRMIFNSLVSWHEEPKKITKLALEKWYAGIEDDLEERGCLSLRALLRWLVGDLANGAALREP